MPELRGKRTNDDSLRAIKNLARIKSLSLLNTSVTDEGFTTLCEAINLEELDIASELITDRALAAIRLFPRLRSLLIRRAPLITDRGVAHLAQAIELRELYLNETAITDAGLGEISHLPNLWSLCLDETRITGKGFSVGCFPKLSLLMLSNTRVTGEDLTSLPNNEHFHLYLDQTPLQDSELECIAKSLGNLKLLSLKNTGITDASLAHVANLPRLNDLRLNGTAVTDSGTQVFAGHPMLESLNVQETSVTAQGVKKLKLASRRMMIFHSDK